MAFEDKAVWITGASSGIGEALAYAFHEHGAKLILSARREDELQRVLSNCKGAQGRHLILPLDVTKLSGLEDKAVVAQGHFGKLDILVNNAGISQRALVKDTMLEVDQAIMNVNYFGTIALTKHVLPSMIERKSGDIVVISSLVGKFSTPLRSAYAASKHALHGFFDSLRAEVWLDNINILLVCPGFVKTNVSRNALMGDGRRYEKVDEAIANGLPPSLVAKATLKAIRTGREEICSGTGKEIPSSQALDAKALLQDDQASHIAVAVVHNPT